MMGTVGRALLTRRAVVPDSVKAMMARAPISEAISAAASAMAAPTEPASRQGRAPGQPGGRPGWGLSRWYEGWLSAARHTLAIALIDSTGWAPIEVSCDSITASVPSQMALATSEASARVGRLLVTIDSSISVAVMTGTPARVARSIT